jgi:hypothetical protein
MLAELDTIEAEAKRLASEIAKYADNDPKRLEKMRKALGTPEPSFYWPIQADLFFFSPMKDYQQS